MGAFIVSKRHQPQIGLRATCHCWGEKGCPFLQSHKNKNPHIHFALHLILTVLCSRMMNFYIYVIYTIIHLIREMQDKRMEAEIWKQLQALLRYFTCLLPLSKIPDGNHLLLVAPIALWNQPGYQMSNALKYLYLKSKLMARLENFEQATSKNTKVG